MAQNNANGERFPNVKLTDIGVVNHLRKEYGMQATTAIQSKDAANPNQQVATIAVQQAVHGMDDEWKELLDHQGFEQVEHIGRGLYAWERDGV